MGRFSRNIQFTGLNERLEKKGEERKKWKETEMKEEEQIGKEKNVKGKKGGKIIKVKRRRNKGEKKERKRERGEREEKEKKARRMMKREQ